MRLRDDQAQHPCAWNFGYADRIQKHSCLLSLGDKEVNTCGQTRGYFSLALGLQML
jgi:hypothetical protein